MTIFTKGSEAYCVFGQVTIIAEGVVLPCNNGRLGIAGICDTTPSIIRYWFSDGTICPTDNEGAFEIYDWRLAGVPVIPRGAFTAGYKAGQSLVVTHDYAAICLAEEQGYRFFSFKAFGAASPELKPLSELEDTPGRARASQKQAETKASLSVLSNAVVVVFLSDGKVTNFHLAACCEELPPSLDDKRVPRVKTVLLKLSPFGAPERITLTAARELLEGQRQ